MYSNSNQNYCIWTVWLHTGSLSGRKCIIMKFFALSGKKKKQLCRAGENHNRIMLPVIPHLLVQGLLNFLYSVIRHEVGLGDKCYLMY